MYSLNRNYSTRNFKENGNNLKYECSTNNPNLSFYEENDKINIDGFCDNNVDDEIDNFFCTMDSFYIQRKELEDFDKYTKNKIQEINNWYDNKKSNFLNKFETKKNKIINDYKESLELKMNDYYFFDDFYEDTYIENTIKEMENKLYSECDKVLESLENKRNQTISNYEKRRLNEKNQIKKKHKQTFLEDYY